MTHTEELSEGHEVKDPYSAATGKVIGFIGHLAVIEWDNGETDSAPTPRARAYRMAWLEAQ